MLHPCVVGVEVLMSPWTIVIGFSAVLLGFAAFMLYVSHRSRCEQVKAIEARAAGTPTVLEEKDDPQVRLRQPRPQKDMPENVKLALLAYTLARLEANGNEPITLKQLLTEFARWHGPKNLDRGILRPEPPPIPEKTVVTTMVGEA